jgi:hypothetical protein
VGQGREALRRQARLIERTAHISPASAGRHHHAANGRPEIAARAAQNYRLEDGAAAKILKRGITNIDDRLNKIFAFGKLIDGHSQN